jgi:peptidyl-prolyl cis-trans isomerase SurA
MMLNIKKGILFLMFLIFSTESAEALTVDKVIAKANNEIITLSDYKKFVSQTENYADKENVDESLLRKMIDEKLILQEASLKGIDVTEAEAEQLIRDFMNQNGINRDGLEKNLELEGISYSEYKKLIKVNMLSSKIIDMEVNSKIIVSDNEISDHYNKNKKLFLADSEKVQINAILFRIGENPSMTEITDLKIKSMKTWSMIKKGEPFEKIAAQYSKVGQGNVDVISGEFEKGELAAALEKEVLKTIEGDITKPVWTKDGVYIIKLINKSKETYNSLDKVRSHIYSTLYDLKREEKFNEWMKSLWGKSSVKIILP